MEWIARKFKGWKTIWANILMAAVPVLEAANLADVLPDGWLKWYMIGMAGANIALRYMTTTAIGAKE